MEVQQHTEINLGGARSAGPSSRANSSVNQADEKQASAPFKDEVKKQIDQVKAQSESDKPVNNHKDSDDSVAEEVAAETPQNNAQSDSESHAETAQDDQQVPTQAATGEEEQQTEDAINVFASQLDASLLNPSVEAPVAANITVTLPQGGNSLPTSQADLDALALQQSMVAKVTASEQGGIQSAGAQSESIKAESLKAAATLTTDAEPVAVDAKLFKLGNTADRPVTANVQFSDMMTEQQTADMAARASRLQQVPLTTAIASSVQAASNSSLTQSAALTDSSATFNLNAPITQGLSTAIAAPVQSAGWSQQMTDQVNVMLKGGFQQAEIKLNPAHLGPMEIKLSVHDDKANIHFVAQHAPVRDAIDASMPRLRDMLEQQGLNLADVDVSSQSDQQQAQGDSAPAGSASARGADMVEGESVSPVITESVTMTVDSGINLYA